jgi:hypothetical protein
MTLALFTVPGNESRIAALRVSHPMILLSPLVLLADPSGVILPTEPDRQQSREQLRDWWVPAEEAGLETEALFDEGNPVARILERPTSLPAGLIAMDRGCQAPVQTHPLPR